MTSRALHFNFNGHTTFLFRHHCTKKQLQHAQSYQEFTVKNFKHYSCCSGIAKQKILACGIRNPRLWNPEPTNDSGIRNSSFIGKESRTQCLESEIHGVVFKIQDCLGEAGFHRLMGKGGDSIAQHRVDSLFQAPS